MKVAITGANGFIGRRTIFALRSAGLNPLALTRQNVGILPGVESRVILDPWSSAAWREGLRNVDAVVHLIGHAHHAPLAREKPDQYRSANVDVTSTLISAMEAVDLRVLVFMSSVKAVAEITESESIQATTPARPSSPYGVSKLQAEDLLEAWAERTGAKLVVLRPPLVYGPGVKGNLRQLLRLADTPVPLPLGGIHNARSLISLDNLSDAVICALESEALSATRLPLADPEPISTTELVRQLRRLLHRPSRLIPIPGSWLEGVARVLGMNERVSKLTQDLVISNADAQGALGWVPRQSTAEGLAVMVDSYLATDGWTRPPQ